MFVLSNCGHLDWVLNYVVLQPVIHNIRLAKQSTVGDVLEEIKGKVYSINYTELAF